MYKRVEPVSIAEIERKRYLGHNTICQKIREVYALTNDEEIKLRCRIMLKMAKSMHNKLKWYKANSKT